MLLIGNQKCDMDTANANADADADADMIPCVNLALQATQKVATYVWNL